jgi:hypothetical protein
MNPINGHRLYIENWQDLPHIVTLVAFEHQGTKQYRETILTRLGVDKNHQRIKICPVLIGHIYQVIAPIIPRRITSSGCSWDLSPQFARQIQELIQVQHQPLPDLIGTRTQIDRATPIRYRHYLKFRQNYPARSPKDFTFWESAAYWIHIDTHDELPSY